MFAYCLNNPVMYSDNCGFYADDLYYFAPVETLHRLVLAEKKRSGNWEDNPNKRKGSQNRQPSGARERNKRHKDGEEHSRKPKGNGMPIRRMQENPAFAYTCVYYGEMSSAYHTGNSTAVAYSHGLTTIEYAFFDASSFADPYAIGLIGISATVIVACAFMESCFVPFEK